MAQFRAMTDTKANTTQNPAEIFDDAQAAAYVGGITPRAIRDWRTRRGLPFIRITSKVCRIRRTDLDRWMAEHRVSITRNHA
ncbi:MAG: helix-turn-helix domain-containing protein [Limisphaerales bacterium]